MNSGRAVIVGDHILRDPDEPNTDFAAPETLVAFALGITLFVITLGLNVLALWIVRKYREQYE